MLQTAQNKMIRFMQDYDCRHHLTCKDFWKVKYLNVQSRFDYLSLNLLHSIHNGKAPDYLCRFVKVTDVHSHNTRNSHSSQVIPQVSTQGKKTFMYNAAKQWNMLPNSLKSLVTIKILICLDIMYWLCKCKFCMIVDDVSRMFTLEVGCLAWRYQGVLA